MLVAAGCCCAAFILISILIRKVLVHLSRTWTWIVGLRVGSSTLNEEVVMPHNS
ncbi:hypothetical protein BDN67DRAFT_974384 [Paxillus ammoniavirescens]|nr:hypothetical protein BDN67DRAFT_974384 [Paxillus ammoniavirescens]